MKDFEQAFYEECIAILGSAQEYRKFPYSKRTRWNNRTAGNGRFEGYGIVRMYSPSIIHISFRNPKINLVCKSAEEAFSILRGVNFHDKS